jgi:formylglycine-generating enzyme required for sulfatase activity
METNEPNTYILSDVPAEEDALDFTPYSQTLIKIIQSPNTATPLTIGVFGTWGSGKTSLMRMVSKGLPENFQKVWFDAWKYDKEEALWRALLLQVLANVRSLAEEIKPQKKAEKEEHQKALDALDDLESSLYRSVEREQLGELRIDWQELLKGSLETAVHVGIALVPGLRIAQAVMEQAGKKAATDDPGGLLKAVEHEKNKIYSEHIHSLEQFQDKFKWLVDQLIRQRDTKLVVFIDDLDRCTPEKAIAVLEAVKLFLDVEGCVFVLGLDQDVVARGVELKYLELGKVNESDEKLHPVISGAHYLEKIIQLPFQIPPIEPEDMDRYVNSLVKVWPDKDCSTVFAKGLGDNPRQVKRAVNVFLLLSALSEERVQKLQGRIKPVRLAKVVVIQNIYPELYEVLKRTPRLLRDLEAYYRSAAASSEPEKQLTEEESGAGTKGLEPPPVLVPYINRAAIQRILTMHPSEKPDANFIELTPDELRLYFTLTRQAESPQVVQKEIPRGIFEPQMVFVPAGKFKMGSTEEQIEMVIREGMKWNTAQNEGPQNSPELPEYLIGKYLVTNLEYQSCIKETKHPSPKNWNGTEYPEDQGDHPVVYINWYDALAYCEWLTEKTGKSYRLPSEAEWEKAARGERGFIYPWGDQFDPDKCNTIEAGPGRTTPVGQYSPNGDSPYGCTDMAGNVWEWTRSILEKYPYQADDGREDLGGIGRRVLRGGAFYNSLDLARCAYRNSHKTSYWNDNLGFRVVVSPSS